MQMLADTGPPEELDVELQDAAKAGQKITCRCRRILRVLQVMKRTLKLPSSSSSSRQQEPKILLCEA